MVLIDIWAMTRVPNPITGGRALPINSLSIIELFEFAFIIITAIIISVEKSQKAPKINQKYTNQ